MKLDPGTMQSADATPSTNQRLLRRENAPVDVRDLTVLCLRGDVAMASLARSADDRAAFQVDVQIVEALHGAPKAKLRAFADAADLPQIPEDKNQGSARKTIGNVNRGATVAELDQGSSTPFENQRCASVTRSAALESLLNSR